MSCEHIYGANIYAEDTYLINVAYCIEDVLYEAILERMQSPWKGWQISKIEEALPLVKKEVIFDFCPRCGYDYREDPWYLELDEYVLARHSRGVIK